MKPMKVVGLAVMAITMATAEESHPNAVDSKLQTAEESANSNLQVNVYDGPTECKPSEVVKMGATVGMHYIGSIDSSSTTGEPGLQFDSSRERGVVLERVIGIGQLIQGWDEGLVATCPRER